MSNAGKPVALFPLRHGVIRRFGLTLRSWEILWPNDMGVCDFVFARSEANQACLAKLIAFLRKEKEFAWDVLHLPDILEDSCARYALPATPWPLMQVHKHHHSKSIPCDSDYESVMNRLSGDFRRNLRRQKKKLMELVPIDIRFNAQDAGQDEAFQYFLQAEAASWKGEAGTKSAVQLHSAQTRFYRTLLDEFSRYGACSINVILVKAECIASQFCLTVDDTLYLLKIGYDEQYKNLGPGNVLLHELIQRCCSDPKIRRISFVTGANWNDRWAPESLDVYQAFAYNLTVRGLAAFAFEWVRNRARRVKHRMLAKSGETSAGSSA